MAKEHLWKPGVSGNPNGRPKPSPDLADIKATSKEDIARLITKYGLFHRDALDEFLLRRDVPVLDQTVANIYAKALDHGDFARLSFLLDRTIGKVATDVVISQKIRAEVEAMSDAELIEIAKQRLLEAPK